MDVKIGMNVTYFTFCYRELENESKATSADLFGLRTRGGKYWTIVP